MKLKDHPGESCPNVCPATSWDIIKWVLSYYETDYSTFSTENSSSWYYKHVSNITLLELHFKTNGKMYNLGVVDNKTSEQPKPINEREKPDLKKLIVFIIICVAIIFLVILCLMYFPQIFMAIADFFAWLFKIIFKKE